MSTVGQHERATQNRVIALFRDELKYRYLGDWTDRDGNSNVEEGLLTAWLTKRGCIPAQISAALHKLRTEADNHNRTLYGNNQAVYHYCVRGPKGEQGGQLGCVSGAGCWSGGRWGIEAARRQSPERWRAVR